MLTVSKQRETLCKEMEEETERERVLKENMKRRDGRGNHISRNIEAGRDKEIGERLQGKFQKLQDWGNLPGTEVEMLLVTFWTSLNRNMRDVTNERRAAYSQVSVAAGRVAGKGLGGRVAAASPANKTA
jgi:hypothetical protein